MFQRERIFFPHYAPLSLQRWMARYFPCPYHQIKPVITFLPIVFHLLAGARHSSFEWTFVNRFDLPGSDHGIIAKVEFQSHRCVNQAENPFFLSLWKVSKQVRGRWCDEPKGKFHWLGRMANDRRTLHRNSAIGFYGEKPLGCWPSAVDSSLGERYLMAMLNEWHQTRTV